MSPYSGLQSDYMARETMYDRLTRVNQDFDEALPNLAKSWDTNDDFTEWTFHLQENATFANTGGQKVLAEDIKATVEFIQSKQCPGCEKDLGPLETISILDDHTVKITLNRPDLEYARRIAETGSTFNIAPKNILEDDPKKLDETCYGSGPFILSDWKKGYKATFEAKDSYHVTGKDEKPLPYLDTMTWVVQPNKIARVNMLNGGRVDCLSRFPSTLIEKARGQTEVVRRQSGRQLPIVLNTTIKPFQSVDLRQAMKYGMDRTQLLTSISNRGTLGHHAAITPIQKYYAKDISPGYKFGTTAKPKKARQKLTEAGYGGGLTLPTLYYDGGVPEKEIFAQLFQQQMKHIGLDFEIQRLTEETWLANYFDQDDVWYIGNWSTRVISTTIPSLAMRSDAVWNTARWSNKAYDKALEKAITGHC